MISYQSICIQWTLRDFENPQDSPKTWRHHRKLSRLHSIWRGFDLYIHLYTTKIWIHEDTIAEFYSWECYYLHMYQCKIWKWLNRFHRCTFIHIYNFVLFDRFCLYILIDFVEWIGTRTIRVWTNLSLSIRCSVWSINWCSWSELMLSSPAPCA